MHSLAEKYSWIRVINLKLSTCEKVYVCTYLCALRTFSQPSKVSTCWAYFESFAFWLAFVSFASFVSSANWS